jgi:hypothetical protein
MALLIVPSFQDQKKKSSGGGGFSDGGVRSQRLSLSAATTEVGPPPGNAWSGFGGQEDEQPSVQAINFATNAGCVVNEYFVSADGTERKTGETRVNKLTDADTLTPLAVRPCSPYLQGGGILAYPNKLRYRLTLGYGDSVLPTGRVLLHFDVAEFDMPKDQEPD